MNEWIALSVFLIFSFSTLFLVVKGRIGNGAAMVFLSFSILAGWGIAGYDRLRELGGRIHDRRFSDRG